MGSWDGPGVGSSEWSVDGDGNLTPKDGEPVSVEQATIGVTEARPWITQESKTVTAPGSYQSVEQAILNETPWIIDHPVTIDITDGDYNEHLYIPPAWTRRTFEGGSEDSRLTIRGDNTNPGDVVVNSVMVDSVKGYDGCRVQGITADTGTTRDDENAGFIAYGTDHWNLNNCAVTGDGSVETAAIAYNSHLHLSSDGLDIGDREVSDSGIKVKHGGVVSHGASASNVVFGQAPNYAYVAAEGMILIDGTKANVGGDSGIVSIGSGMMMEPEGYYIRSPDESTVYRIDIDNDGNVGSTQINSM